VVPVHLTTHMYIRFPAGSPNSVCVCVLQVSRPFIRLDFMSIDISVPQKVLLDRGKS